MTKLKLRSVVGSWLIKDRGTSDGKEFSSIHRFTRKNFNKSLKDRFFEEVGMTELERIARKL